MRTLVAALLASAFIAGPAFACGFGKTAKHKMSTTTASNEEVKVEQSMSTFDPAKLPTSEEPTEVTKEPVLEEVEPVIE